MDKAISSYQPQTLNSLNRRVSNAVDSVLPRIESSHLFNGVREIIIEHMGQEYHLRLTNQGKLLLTK